MKIENRIFNQMEYTLVDFYDLNKKEIVYHFAGDELDLFCKKDGEEYIQIRNENVIKDINEYYLLIKPEFYFSVVLPAQLIRLLGVTKLKKLPIETREQIIHETTQKLAQSNIKKEDLEKRLKKVKIYTGKWGKDVETLAFYHPGTETIVLFEDECLSDKGKRTRLHEIVHAISGQAALFISTITNYTGLTEGAVENIVEKIYGNKTSRNEIILSMGDNDRKRWMYTAQFFIRCYISSTSFIDKTDGICVTNRM